MWQMVSLCLPKCDTEESKRCCLLLLLTPYDVWFSAHARPIIEGVTLPNNGLVARTWKAVLAVVITLMVVGK